MPFITTYLSLNHARIRKRNYCFLRLQIVYDSVTDRSLYMAYSGFSLKCRRLFSTQIHKSPSDHAFSGIPLDDLDSLGRRGHTSKLRCFEDLKYLGGSTLGFRGEALASAVQLGDVSITTKTDGEAIATTVKLQALGGFKDKSRASHPVGTTVSVVNFMYKLPVRRKTFEKESSKSLAKIRQLLQAFALARHSVKFSFKVMKREKDSWSFALRATDGIKEAVSLVIGRDAALQCTEKSLSFSDSELFQLSTQGGVVGDGDEVGPGLNHTSLVVDGNHKRFILEAFLPKLGSDFSKIGKGQYLSVDSRPVSHEKGTMKKIVTLFKAYLRGAIGNDIEKIKSPFICLNLRCPTASYDANVEPAKDDVLFGNEALVLSFIEQLLKNVYGELKVVQKPVAPRPLNTLTDNQELLRSRKPIPWISVNPPSTVPALEISPKPTVEASDASSSVIEHNSNKLASSTETDLVPNALSRGKRRDWGFDMSDGFSEEDGGLEQSGPNRKAGGTHRPKQDGHGRDHLDHGSNSSSTLNPWVIAKMVAPSTRDLGSLSNQITVTPSKPRGDQHSTANATLKAQAEGRIHEEDTMVLQPPNADLQNSRPLAGSLAHVQLPLSSGISLPPNSEDSELFIIEERHELGSMPRNDFTSARNIPADLLVTPPPTLLSKKPQRPRNTITGPNKPFVSPMAVVKTKALLQASLPPRYQQLKAHNPRRDNIMILDTSSDLSSDMDYEHRKEEMTRRLREDFRAAQRAEEHSNPAAPTRSSPHKNRYNAAIATLDSQESTLPSIPVRPSKVPFKTSLSENDPRAYLMRCKNSMAAHPVEPGGQPRMRAKSVKLPLERIPDGASLHKLSQTYVTTTAKVRTLGEILLHDEGYIHYGKLPPGLLSKGSEMAALTMKTEAVVSTWLNNSDEKRKCEVEFSFENLREYRSMRG